jgi:hypothetical protein
MSIWRLLSIIPGGGSLAVIACVLIMGRRGRPCFPLFGIAISLLAIAWGALHPPRGIALWVQGAWFGLLILSTCGVWSGIWAAMTASRDLNASRWSILGWTILGAFAGRVAGFMILVLVGPLFWRGGL